ncbi:putative disease resistance RPP13-like protein 1 isoform X2 [Cannabis sativa]|uniref:putative disease resistance RPP13-like protein 1 isoform X2 n=1 Tax=Cannabis sativa TaxID=3483 RepID=UPI0029CA922C|nr:putative disease resistance RPP13-like protein 1 isoform X2 [Cannabis sativa]
MDLDLYNSQTLKVLEEFLAGTTTVNLDDFQKTYDVYISFRGTDDRCNFTGHLYAALMKSGIETYLHNRVDTTEEFSKAVMDIIGQSKFCIVLFSENYASSWWCLNELVHIQECMEKRNLIVLPVFYYVNPSDVRGQKRSYEDAFVKNAERFDKDQIKKWRVALTTAATQFGWDATNTKNEAELVDEIVNFIRRKMDEAIIDLNKRKSGPPVSVSVDFLLKKISSGVVRFLRGKNDSDFSRLLHKIETTFLSLNQVLGDAELKQIRNASVEKWLDKLQDVVEDAEVFFEEIEYDALKLKVELESDADDSKVAKFLSRFNLTRQKRKSDLEKILEQLDVFENQKYILNLRGDVENIQSERLPSKSFINSYEIYGRDDEMNILKGMLLLDKVGSEKISVIPIVGMSGIGKTTLTEVVFNNDEVNKHFELKAWVCVSEELDVCKVTQNILVALTRNACAVEDLIVLQEEVQELLNKKKFLLVLDDVWNTEFWDKIRLLFEVGAQGSKIIITTSNMEVASIVGTTGPHHLELLKEKACFELFVKLVSDNEGFTTTDSYLGSIAKELLKKCRGLPLAVRAIASLLRCTSVKEWEKIADSDVLDLSLKDKYILPCLGLSYYYLPSHLKRCFLYCSMFPRNYGFVKDELVLLWMVDNILEHSGGNRNIKEVGYEYFDDLVARSFFQPAACRFETKGVFVVHDLMAELAAFVSKNKFIYVKENMMYDIGQIRQIRHIAIDVFVNRCDFHETCKLISKAAYLRTLVHVNKNPFLSNSYLQDDVLKDFMKLGHLRYLSLAGYENVVELPESVGELRHLRHLDLSHTSIKELPESMCLLYNLQILNLSHCMHLTKLPENLHHLISLRSLYISKCRVCTLPPLGQLPALLTLSIKGCDAIEKVGLDFYGTSSSKLFPLLESLTFKKMKNWKEWSMPKENVESFSKLKSLTIHECERLAGDLPCILPSLKELEISYCPMIASPLPVLPNVSRVSVMQCAKIVGFKSCSNLEDLCLKNCYKLHFPLTSNYKSLQKLSVENISSSFKLLPLDSLPNIMNVRVCNCENLESFSLLNSLNSLYTLSIEECPNFTLLPDSNLDCPILTKLVIYSCDKLRFLPEKLPNLLPSLMVLVIDDCPELESIARSGLPFSLRELTIRNCNKLIASRKNWNLQILPSLGSFCIGDYECDDMESFLEQGSLPTSLTSLTIEDVAYLKTLDENGFQELKSLKELHMSRCPKLQSLPVKGLPPSFNGLLPPSFETFFMNDCPLLEANYEWEEGNDLGGKICCIPVKPQESQALEPSSLELVSTKNTKGLGRAPTEIYVVKVHCDGHPDDGFSWKQYGQKNILGAKYPRGYYRCTYRHSKGCLAKKILQRLDDDPRMVEVKYSGKHTCTNDVGHVIGSSTDDHTFSPMSSITADDLVYWDDLL